MNLEDRLDEEHAAALRAIPPGFMDLSDIDAARQRFAAMFEELSATLPPVEGVSVEEHTVPGPERVPDTQIRLYRPTNAGEPLPCLLWFHSGGMVMGDLDQDDFACSLYAAEVGCAVASVDYRLSPEHPFPAPLEDGYAALRWLATSGAASVDPGRIAVGGASAGAGLAAGLALFARDKAEYDIMFQMLIYPMLDDRNVTDSSHEIDDLRTWNREANLVCWDAYLPNRTTAVDVSGYASPSRATDLSGLPPAYIAVGDLDLFRDEDLEYARRLLKAGVPTDLHVYAGAFHGSDNLVPMSTISERQISDRNVALRHAFSVQFVTGHQQ